MLSWLQTLRQEWEAILKEEPRMTVFQAQKLWFDTLHEANRKYRKLYCFADAFYEFFGRAEEPAVQAAVILLQRLVERNQLEENQSVSWLKEKELLDRPERLEAKRYLAILGNPALRKTVFGF